MSTVKQKQVKYQFYNEVIRYMDNAEETLKKAGKEDGFFKDEKYLKTACSIDYNGVLKALDGYFVLKNVSHVKKNAEKAGNIMNRD